MANRTYDKYEIVNKINKAIEDERKNSKAFCDWNSGKNAEERKKAEEYTISRLTSLLYEF